LCDACCIVPPDRTVADIKQSSDHRQRHGRAVLETSEDGRELTLIPAIRRWHELWTRRKGLDDVLICKPSNSLPIPHTGRGTLDTNS
jgi:hypothetical protein